MVRKFIRIKVRTKVNDYDVYQKEPLDDGDWKPVTKGTVPAAEDNKIQFRWGI
jgi:hypothetical protein